MALTAETANPGPESRATACGQELRTRDVLVLDLQHLVGTPDLADDFVLEQAGTYRLTDPLIQEFRMSFRPSSDPEGVARGARKLGVRKGCDLVLVLKTGPYLGKQRSWKSRMKDHGYALVAVGQRVADSP
jgi:hypothetical protein